MTTDELQKWADLDALLRGAISKIEQIRQSVKSDPPPVRTRGEIGAERLLDDDGCFWARDGCEGCGLYDRDDVPAIRRLIANAIDRTAAEAVAEALAKERREIAEMLARHGYTSIAADIAKRK